ncbi:hypothetical protein DFJ74DRAFT_706362 [Hyaloraphidium curvatum]|nr:hypothetical protein DFJ74DRAFT_706362 [Hyaloraphidium curvatum]
MGDLGIPPDKMPDRPSVYACLPERGPTFVEVPLYALSWGGSLRRAVAWELGFRAGDEDRVVELRFAGPLQPEHPESAALWRASRPVGEKEDLDHAAVAGGFFVARTAAWQPAPTPVPPPRAAGADPEPGVPAVTVAFPELGPPVRVSVRGVANGRALRAAVRERFRLDAARFSALELRLAGLDPPGGAGGLLWDGLPPIADGDPFPDRERGFDWGCVVVARCTPAGQEDGSVEEHGIFRGSSPAPCTPSTASTLVPLPLQDGEDPAAATRFLEACLERNDAVARRRERELEQVRAKVSELESDPESERGRRIEAEGRARQHASLAGGSEAVATAAEELSGKAGELWRQIAVLKETEG